MSPPDLNLLVALDVLLEEQSVVKAARRLRLSPSAMSRTLARLREATGDPILVLAGRKLVPTPRSAELRDRVKLLVRDAEAVLRPAREIAPKTIDRTFTLRVSEGFVETFGPALMERLSAEAPGARLHFVQKVDKDSARMREGLVDLETGVVDGAIGPEVRALALFVDRHVGVVRIDHPLATSEMTLASFLSGRHVEVRRGREAGPVDVALSALGLSRTNAIAVSGFASAIALARSTDLIASVPERHTVGLRVGVHTFELPFATPTFTVSLLWHPRMEEDRAHRWMRAAIRDVCRTPACTSS